MDTATQVRLTQAVRRIMKPVSRAVILCLLVTASVSAQVWQQPVEAMSGPPSARQNAAAIYDPVADRVVLMGGRGSSGDLNDTWALDLSTLQWQQLTTTETTPAARHTHNAVYDPGSHQMLIWSGRSITAEGSTLRNDVWRLDLATMAWHEIIAARSVPNARYGTAAIFDVAAGELVNFAGFTDAGRFDDTWRLHPASGQWRDVSSPIRPGARCLHTGAYDSVRERMIIFGGQRGPAALDDVWSLNLATNRWDALPAMPAGGRRFPAASFDSAGERFLTFGGEKDGRRYSDLWALSTQGSEWHLLSGDSEGPPPRDRAVLIHDEARGRLVLFGGTGDTGHLADTWILPLRPPTVVEAPIVPQPNSLALSAAYPNPFNGEIHVGVHVGGNHPAQLTVFDLLGRPVRTLQEFGPGVEAQRSWDATDDDGRPVASGVYLLRLQAGDEAVFRRIALVR
jgi:hypothetical protein